MSNDAMYVLKGRLLEGEQAAKWLCSGLVVRPA